MVVHFSRIFLALYNNKVKRSNYQQYVGAQIAERQLAAVASDNLMRLRLLWSYMEDQ
jgi:hypothetical protein